MKPQHKHLLVHAEVNKPFRFEDQNEASIWLKTLVEKIGMKICSGPHVAFATAEGNTGITACVLIETSHCSLHVWDSNNPPLVQLDVYTCSDLDIKKVFEHMEVMEPISIKYKFLDREDGFKELESGSKR